MMMMMMMMPRRATLTGTDALTAGNKTVIAECRAEMTVPRMSGTFLVTSLPAHQVEN